MKISRVGLRFQCIAIVSLLGAANNLSADDSAYDQMRRSYGVYVNPADPLAWPMKVRSIARDEYHFWRGTRDIFYDWCRIDCQDWLADKDAIVTCHGDLHFGNMGTYATAWNTVAIGLVDFDESARLPFQIELLQCLITLNLVETQNKIELSDAQKNQVQAALLDAYFAASIDAGASMKRLADDPLFKTLIAHGQAKTYADDLKKYCDGEHFKTVVLKKSQPVDIIEEIPAAQRGDFAAGIAEGISHDDRLSALLKFRTAAELSDAIVSIGRRTRIDSSGSQGLLKYVVRLRSPMRNADGDLILYLKQQIPAASERVGAASADARPPAERCARDADTLLTTPMLANSWCQIQGHSFWLSVKEPWSDELSADAFTTPQELVHAAEALGSIAGASHAKSKVRLPVAWSPYLLEKLNARAAAYEKFQAEQFSQLKIDPRAQRDIADADVRIAGLKTKR